MAFPTTVTTNLDSYHGIGGPYVSSSSNVYILGRYTPTGNEIQVFKATDPTSAFAGVGVNPVMTSGNLIRAIGACQVADNIHVITRDANVTTSVQLRYHRFNMATDTWDVSNELVHNSYTQAGAVDTSMVGIAVRSGGDKLVIYEGPQVLADINRARTYYARNIGGAGWSADFALDNGGNNHWYPSEVILGSGNRVHFFFINTTLSDQYQRCLTSANALEAFPAALDAAVQADPDDGTQRPVAFSGSAGGTVVCLPYFKDYTPTWNDVRFTSTDAPTPLTIRTINTGTITPAAATLRRTFSFANDSNTIYSVFNSQTGNLYVASATETGAWNAPAQLVGSASASEVFTTVFTRNGSRKVGVCYTRNLTDVMYTEYTLSVAPSGWTEAQDKFSASGQTIVSGRMNAPIQTTTIAFDNAAATGTNVAANTFGMLLTATANACLLVFINLDTNSSVSAVNAGAAALTFKGDVLFNGATGMRSELWVLTAPPAGALTISAVLAGAEAVKWAMAGVTYTGHKTTGDPFGGVMSATAGTTPVLNASLVVSSTVGNVVVAAFNNNQFAFGTTPTAANYNSRIATIQYPDITVFDGPGRTNTTAIAVATSAVQWGVLGINLIQSGSATTSGGDLFSASGRVLSVIPTGRLSATDAHDSFSISGYVVVTARLSATGILDKFSASGIVVNTVAVTGRLSATDARDTLSASGQIVVRGRLSATDAHDLFSGSASTLTPIHGSIAWTERRDVLSAPRPNPSLGTPLTSSNAGGGAGRSNRENVPIPVDLWAAREAYLQSLFPEGPAPVIEADNTAEWEEYERRKQQIVDLTAERAHAIVELRNSADLQSMKQQGAKITELTAKISTLTGKQQFTRLMH